MEKKNSIYVIIAVTFQILSLIWISIFGIYYNIICMTISVVFYYKIKIPGVKKFSEIKIAMKLFIILSIIIAIAVGILYLLMK